MTVLRPTRSVRSCALDDQWPRQFLNSLQGITTIQLPERPHAAGVLQYMCIMI